MSKRIISIDGTILNTFQMCARKAQYNFEKQLQPHHKAEPLERGDLLHKMMELYYGLNYGEDGHWIIKHRNDTITSLVDAGMLTLDEDFTDWEKRVRFAVEAGRFFSVKMELDIPEIEETIYHFGEYCKHFRYDSWEPLAVEEVGTRKIFENQDVIIVYNFKVDAIMRKNGMIMPWDHKTSKRAQSPSSLSNQFMGYAFCLDMNHIVINKVGFQKTISADKRFLREILTYDAERKQEWLANTIWWTQMYDYHRQTDTWPMNLTSCDKYSGCIYATICERPPSVRDMIQIQEFQVGKAWDVASVLEKS